VKIGFLGLGRMGAAMATNLCKAGYEVAVWNRSAGRADEVTAAGAKIAASVAEAAHADIVISMLADDRAVEDVLFGDAGLLAGGAPVHISMSTISVALADRLDGAHREHGGVLVSAPVFGRPEAAQAAGLAIVAAGRPEAVAASRPILAAMGDRVFVVGERPSAANLLKLCGNFLVVSAIEALAEALTLAQKGGLAPAAFIDVLTQVLPHPVYELYGPLMQARRFSPPGFAVPLGLKDVELMAAAAKTLRTPMPLLGVVHDHLLSLLAQEGEDIDWSAILLPIERAAGATAP